MKTMSSLVTKNGKHFGTFGLGGVTSHLDKDERRWAERWEDDSGKHPVNWRKMMHGSSNSFLLCSIPIMMNGRGQGGRRPNGVLCLTFGLKRVLKWGIAFTVMESRNRNRGEEMGSQQGLVFDGPLINQSRMNTPSDVMMIYLI
jgi:hypothetical protein